MNKKLSTLCKLILLIAFTAQLIAQTLTIPGISEITSGNIGYIEKEDKTEAYYFLSVTGERTSKDDELMDYLLTIVDVSLQTVLTYHIRLGEKSFIKGIAQQDDHFGIVFADDEEERQWLEILDESGKKLRSAELVFPNYHEKKIPEDHHLMEQSPIAGVIGGFIVHQHTAPNYRIKGWRDHQVLFFSLENPAKDWASSKIQLENRDYWGGHLWSNDTLVLSNQIGQGFNIIGNYTVLESQVLAHDLRTGELLFTYKLRGAKEAPRLAWATDDGFAVVGLVYGGESKAQLVSNSYSVYEARFSNKGRHLKTYTMDYYKDIPALIGKEIQDLKAGIEGIGYLYFHQINRLPNGQLVLNLESFDLEFRGHINDGLVCIMESDLTLKSVERIEKKSHGTFYNVNAQKMQYRMTTHPSSWDRTTAIDQGHGNYLVPSRAKNVNPFEPVPRLSNKYFDFVFQTIDAAGTVTFSYFDQEKTDESKTNIRLVSLTNDEFSLQEIALPNGERKYFIWPNTDRKITILTLDKKEKILEVVIM